ncbi:hypothetical protein DVH26_10450 [Paenibacillus sp. H1-7]|uniref:hypothetical protein n=1 Tax=Paenibacillus sp. H1-7 TaxID=2282849 RepID=UPI001EF7B23D|nr:hypothetical protein [Paenibacillus sp. H1-7]ULL14828.1 hypothetical protein DVH26_10450 [Paenibacillus sp. H1-7]
MDKLKKIIIPVVFIGVLILSGCSKDNVEKNTQAPADPAQVKNNNKPSYLSPTNTQSPSQSVKLEAIKYTNEQLTQISELVEKEGLENVYLPKLAVEDNPLTNLEVRDNKLILQYKYMTLEQRKKIWDEVKDEQIKKVTLANGVTGEWINGKDYLPKNRFFRFQMNGMYFILDDYRNLSEEQVQIIAESFVSLDKLKNNFLLN